MKQRKKTPPTHECEFVIKDNVKLCVHCGKVKEVLPPMCELMGECKWVTFNGVTFCSQCGKVKEGRKY